MPLLILVFPLSLSVEYCCLIAESEGPIDDPSVICLAHLHIIIVRGLLQFDSGFGKLLLFVITFYRWPEGTTKIIAAHFYKGMCLTAPSVPQACLLNISVLPLQNMPLSSFLVVYI